MIGWGILNAGVGLLFTNINPITEILRHAFAGQYEAGILARAAEGQSAQFFSTYGPQIGIIMVGAFFVNLLLARFTPMKIVWMTMNLFAAKHLVCSGNPHYRYSLEPDNLCLLLQFYSLDSGTRLFPGLRCHGPRKLLEILISPWVMQFMYPLY